MSKRPVNGKLAGEAIEQIRLLLADSKGTTMHHHRLSASVFSLLALAITSPVLAQSWYGSETIEIQANDSKGNPIAGARVLLSFQGGESQGSPPDVATNQKGRAVVTDLAPGSWQLEVKHPDYLSYVAVFDLRRGKKPAVTASFLEAGGGSLTPMRVKLSKGNPREASPPMPTREARAEPLEPLPAEPTTSAAEAEPPTAPRAGGPPTPDEPSPQRAEPVEAEPRPEPEPETEPATEPSTTQPEAETRAEIAVQPAPVEEPPTEPAPSAVAEVSETAPPTTQVAPATPGPSPPPVADLDAEPEPEVRVEAPPSAEVPSPEVAAEAPPRLEETEAPPLPESGTAVEVADREPEPRREEPTAQPPIEPVQPPIEEEPSLPQPIEEEPVSEATQILESPVEPEPEPESKPEPAEPVVTPPAVAEEVRTPPSPPAETTPAIEPAEPVSVPSVAPEAAIAEEAPAPGPPLPALRMALPDGTPAISSYRDGSCAECRTGEWAVTAAQTAAAGGSACPADVIERARAAADDLGASTELELEGFIGPAADGSGADALSQTESEISRSFRKQLSPNLGTGSNCQVIAIVLPKPVRFVGFRYEAFDEEGGGDCTPGQSCSISRAQWLGNPIIQRGASATVVWGIFENTAEEKPRLGRLKVYFRAPNASWQPPAR